MLEDPSINISSFYACLRLPRGLRNRRNKRERRLKIPYFSIKKINTEIATEKL